MQSEIINQSISLIERYDSVIIGFFMNILLAIVIFVAGQFIAKFVTRQLKKILETRNVEPTIIKFSLSLIRYAIIGFTLVAVLGQLGVQTSSIVAIIGATGLAIGLALQGSLSNFAAGVLLILFRPFRVSDLVTISNTNGTVDAIQIFSTTVITPTGEHVTIPNGQILATHIINFTTNPYRRIDLVINVSYDADIKTVYQVLNLAVEQTPGILTDRNTIIRLTELANSSINYTINAWTTNASYGETRTLLLENIAKNFSYHNIDIPFPTMNLNLKK